MSATCHRLYLEHFTIFPVCLKQNVIWRLADKWDGLFPDIWNICNRMVFGMGDIWNTMFSSVWRIWNRTLPGVWRIWNRIIPDVSYIWNRMFLTWAIYETKHYLAPGMPDSEGYLASEISGKMSSGLLCASDKLCKLGCNRFETQYYIYCEKCLKHDDI